MKRCYHSTDQRHETPAASFDHLVGEREQFVGHSEGKSLGGLEVDDKLESRWLLDRQVGRPFASQ
jgi:hypothetical protein